MELIDPIRLDELADAAGSLPADLSATITERDVVIGELLEEELRLVGSGDPPGADPHWTPRLSLLDADQQETARDVVLRHAIAFGLVDDVTGHDAAVSPLLRIPGEEFEAAEGQLTWVHRAGDADPGRGGLCSVPSPAATSPADPCGAASDPIAPPRPTRPRTAHRGSSTTAAAATRPNRCGPTSRPCDVWRRSCSRSPRALLAAECGHAGPTLTTCAPPTSTT